MLRVDTVLLIRFVPLYTYIFRYDRAFQKEKRVMYIPASL